MCWDILKKWPHYAIVHHLFLNSNFCNRVLFGLNISVWHKHGCLFVAARWSDIQHKNKVTSRCIFLHEQFLVTPSAIQVFQRISGLKFDVQAPFTLNSTWKFQWHSIWKFSFGATTAVRKFSETQMLNATPPHWQGYRLIWVLILGYVIVISCRYDFL